MREVQSPPLYPPFVSQHTVTYDPNDARPLAESFPGFVLPPALANAVRKRQIEFLAGRYCAKAALLRCAPEKAERVVEIGPQREPVWPEGIVGAITHAHGLASAAVACRRDARGIGLDAEPLISAEQAELVADSIAHPRELSSVVGATGWDRPTAVTAAFSAKESLFKALYPQVCRFFDFHDAEVDLFDAGNASFRVRLLSPLSPELAAGFSIGGRFRIAAGVIFTAIVLLADDVS